MSYQPADFKAEIAINGLIHQWYPNVKAELTLMSTAVKADLTTRLLRRRLAFLRWRSR